MLHPKNNRIDYGGQLVPPEGYELSKAIGTTYSLDLEALMLLPVALFYSQLLDGKPDELRYDMLDAITKAAEKITIFYQKGQLKVPQKYHPLIAYWEKGIRPVTMPNYASSFHPKVWVIRYDRKKSKSIYRLVITSRNLTFDRSWDVAFSTMGYVTDKPQPDNQPLIDFLKYISKETAGSVDTQFLKDLQNVAFTVPNGFNSMDFIPMGFKSKGKSYGNPLTQENWDELLIVSPFADTSTLRTLVKNCRKKPYLLSTKEALDGIDPELLPKYNNWQFSDFFEKAEFYESLEEEGVEPRPQKLHAKLFVTMQNNTPCWYLGSANCSDPAQGRNIEFVVGLKSSNLSPFRTKDVYSALTDPAKVDNIPLFEAYDPSQKVDLTMQKNIELEVRKIKYDLTNLTIQGEARLIPGGTAYNLSILIDSINLVIPQGFIICFKPVAEVDKNPIPLVNGSVIRYDDFGGYAESFLSPYLEFSIIKEGILYSHFLLEMEIELPATRMNRIFTSIIDSREKFLKYLTFLLTGEEISLIGGSETENDHLSSSNSSLWGMDGTPLFEKLLIAASRQPGKLESVSKLIERIREETEITGDKIITPEFDGFWSVFKDYMELKK